MEDKEINAESGIGEKSGEQREYVRIPKVQYDVLMDVFLENEVHDGGYETSPFAREVAAAYHDESDNRTLDEIVEETDAPITLHNNDG